MGLNEVKKWLIAIETGGKLVVAENKWLTKTTIMAMVENNG